MILAGAHAASHAAARLGTSGLLTTGHELGAALGVAVLGSVATASGGAGTAAGHRDGFLVAAALAAMLALLALVGVPSVRPTAAARVGLH